MNKNKIEIKSFFKSSPSIINFILKSIDEDKTNTVKQIKDLIFNEFKTNVSIQLIYNILKKNNYVYKKFKFNNNPYSVSEQVNQFKKIIETHNEKNINNCVSIDEISFVLGSKPNNGWFKKNEINEIKCNSKKIFRERYSLLVASSNEKILSYDMCKKGVKSDFFINFMDKLKKMDIKNEKYYLLDNARVHKSKKFNEYLNENKMKIVYNAPYHSETNPIENIFSMLRNNLNRNKNETEVELKKSIDDFCAIDNKIKFKNIFNHSCNMINDFIKKNNTK
jgi:transposase